MKWIKHDTNANQDAKLKRLRMKYGLEGYGLYWYCLELIAADVDQHKLTFELEHDAEIISFDTGIHYERVNEMMSYMVNLNLFESNDGILTCLKLANRLDKSMTSNPMMRKMLEEIRENHDSVMTKSTKVMQDKTRLDKTKDIKDLSSQPTADPLSNNVIDVFEFWKSTMEKTGATKLDSKRKSKIEQRLKDGYTVEQIKQAIVNCSKTPHNMGHNDRGQKYNDIELICRDAANLERFIESKPETAGQQTQHDDTSWGQSMAQPYIPSQQKVLGNE